MLVPPIHARSIIPKSNKHIWFRQHHILMYVRKSSKKRKYLIVKLLGTSSSDRSLYLLHYRCSGSINRWDVLIMLRVLADSEVGLASLVVFSRSSFPSPNFNPLGCLS
jgi:hypothetical protein